MNQTTIELVIYVVGDKDPIKLRDDILTDLKRTYGIRKLGDMGTHVILEYRAPEWSVATALAQIRFGEYGSPRFNSALTFLEEYYRLKGN